MAGLATMGLAVTGVVSLIFGTVLDEGAGIVAAVCAFALFAVLRGAWPWWWRTSRTRRSS